MSSSQFTYGAMQGGQCPRIPVGNGTHYTLDPGEHIIGLTVAVLQVVNGCMGQLNRVNPLAGFRFTTSKGRDIIVGNFNAAEPSQLQDATPSCYGIPLRLVYMTGFCAAWDMYKDTSRVRFVWDRIPAQLPPLPPWPPTPLGASRNGSVVLGFVYTTVALDSSQHLCTVATGTAVLFGPLLTVACNGGPELFKPSKYGGHAHGSRPGHVANPHV
jgi:hypothetical protein